MFKKLKDKLTEEVKIPSQKFTQSMQQLAQAVVSPVSSNNNSTLDTVSNDNFSIDGEFDDTPQGSPVKKLASEGGVAYRGGQATPIRNSFDAGSSAGFMHVDLQQDSSTPKMPQRRSSVSSLASDSSFMFPVLESSGSTYNFQSDLESCSEASESVGPNINKEQLLIAYQKTQQKYHKYKGRYADLARHYRDLERENKNAKHILTECQDKALRRMAELKEQCNLEKQAKAHLEEALRSDLEEKDHLIHTLKTKIKLLRTQVDQTHTGGQSDEKPASEPTVESSETAEKEDRQEDLLTGGDSGHVAASPAALLTPEPANVESDDALKEKVKKLESLLHKCKENITTKQENIKQLESERQVANAKIEALQQQLIAIQKREEEASLSLAKNKQTIHRELESKEEEIKKLNTQLAVNSGKINELQTEITRIQEDSKKEVAASKLEITKLMRAELDNLVAEKKTLEDRLSSAENECKTSENRVSELLLRLEQQEAELSPLRRAKENQDTENTVLLKERLLELESREKVLTDMERKMEKLKPILKSAQELCGHYKQLKIDVANTQSENLKQMGVQAQSIQEKLATIMANVTQDHQKVLSELNDYKRESVSSRESLASVSSKFALLEQNLSTEKSGVESKIAELEKELRRAKEQIHVLEQILESERTLRQKVEEESSNKLDELQNKLDEEKARNELTQKSYASTELGLKASIDQLKEHVKESEEGKEKLAEDYNRLKDRANILEISSEQLQKELEILKTHNGDLMNETSSIQILLDKKNAYVQELEFTSSELESKLSSLQAEKLLQEDNWRTVEADLVGQISAIKTKYDKTAKALKDMKEKEDIQSDSDKVKLNALLKENEERDKQIADLQNTLQKCQSEIETATSRNTELEREVETLTTQQQDQASLVLSLQESNETLLQSVQQLKSDAAQSSTLMKELEDSKAEIQKYSSEKMMLSDRLLKAEEELEAKHKELKTMQENLLTANTSTSNLQELHQTKSNECTSLAQEVQELRKLLELKSEECEQLEYKLSAAQESEELSAKIEECKKFAEKLSCLENDKVELSKALETRCADVEIISSELAALKVEFSEISKLLQVKEEECNDLASKLNNLMIENEKTIQLLRQKTNECEDKEAQLDNLADEMKRVEELSQELDRINDYRDANVEVLSSEASSLAQKVEELTITTQELKEREVHLLAKLQVAQDLEAECALLKQREDTLVSKLNEAETLQFALEAKQKDLLDKSKEIEKLQEENKKLKEAGQNLNELIKRAKEAEAKCAKLEEDGAGLLLRIQKAEESELRCSLLEEEIDAMKKEKAELSQNTQSLHAKTVLSGNNNDEKSFIDAKEPVVEEPCVIKKYADLTEHHQGSDRDNEWQEKYNKLLEQHNLAMQESAATVERLREENLLASNSVQRKERLWDQHEASLLDGNSNGSFTMVEKLQQQLAAVTSQLKESKKTHRQEVDDLRRILLNHGSSNSHVASRSDNLEDATELEYLRNILYEYMMGKEPMILAKVIAAVVKFDSEQTSKVLQREQQRLSLLGHLGIS